MSNRQSRSLDTVAAALAPTFEAQDAELFKSTIIECCSATRRVRAGKDPVSGAFLYQDVPDYPVRLAAAAKGLEWCIGKAVTRSIVANVTPQKGAQYEKDFFAAIMRDPVEVRKLRDTFEKMLTAAATSTDVTATKPTE